MQAQYRWSVERGDGALSPALLPEERDEPHATNIPAAMTIGAVKLADLAVAIRVLVGEYLGKALECCQVHGVHGDERYCGHYVGRTPSA